MDPLSALVLNAWWVAPVAVGGGAVTYYGARYVRSGKYLAIAASRHDVRVALREVKTHRLDAQSKRAEVRRLAVERAAPDRIAHAKAQLREVDREARAALARVRERRAQLAKAHAERSHPELPLDRLRGEFAELTTRWHDYDTDDLKRLGYPSMHDARVPETRALISAYEHARGCRDAAKGPRVTPAEFSAFRDAVAEMRLALDGAERVARGEPVPPGAHWQAGAQDLKDKALDALERAAGGAASGLAEWMQRLGRPKN